MRPYRNLSGDSGVVAYEIEPRAIRVRFAGGAVYRYTHASAGREQVETMKQLAQAGQGLSGYIAQHVRDRYESRLPG